MKRFLSTLLALALIISLVPAAFADDAATETGMEYSGITVKYDFTKFEGAAVDYSVRDEVKSYDTTYGFWKFRTRGGKGTTTRPVAVKDLTTYPCIYVQARTNASGGVITFEETDFVAFEVNVPKTGKYDVSVNNVLDGRNGGTIGVWILPGETKDNEIKGLLTEDTMFKNKSFDFMNEKKLGKVTSAAEEVIEFGDYDFKAGNYIFVYKVLKGNTCDKNSTEVYESTNGDMYLRGITLTGGTGAVYIPMYAPLTITDDTATVANTVVMSDTTAQTLDNTFTVTYDSSNKAVATVAGNGKITKLSNGKTEITATVAKNGGVAMSTVAYEVTDVVDETPKYTTAAFSAVTNVDGYDVDVTVDGASDENKVISTERGSAIVATAPEIPGYKFVGWKRGSYENPVFVSNENPLRMTLLTNTFVTAAYILETYEEEAKVEYYNQNGDYIATLAPSVDAPTPDSITGYTFEEGNWFIGENTKLDLANVTKLTRAVARHTPNASVGTATVNGSPKTDKIAFDSEIVLSATAQGFTSWMRDGKVVSYNLDYTYYLWDDTTITESTDVIPETAYSNGKRLPLIVIENGNGGAYMIEYDKADFEIVEVGILFGTGDITVDSCTAKYTSQRNSDHGQFTAKSSGNARGYLIYNDNGTYRVIYAN